jgi:SSS family solute:Na+ symporter
MLPLFRRCGPSAAILSWAAGLIVFILTKYAFAGQIAELNANWTTTITVAGPILVSLSVFSLCGVLRPWRNAASDELVEALGSDLPADTDRTVVHA